MDETETLSLVALLQASKTRWSDIRVALEDESASDLLAQDLHPTLLDDPFADALEETRRQVEGWRASGITVSSIYSPEYPAQLRSVHDYPPILFSRGEFSPSDERSIAVVGTRSPSDGALRFIAEVVPMLAADGHPIVSGLARGVDSAAMTASLSAGNRTVGVIGTGINRAYPAENRGLQEDIAAKHLLLSQFWPDAPPTRQSFPMRNHVMSAFSSMTLIVEAGENSGTRIQARAATRHARPLIITRAVYVQTQWAKDLVDQGFDVTVVGSATEALATVRSITSRASRPPLWAERALTLAGA